MRYLHFVFAAIALFLICTISAARTPTFAARKRLPRSLVDVPHLRHEQRLQGNQRLRDWLQVQHPVMNRIFQSIMSSSSASNADRKGGLVLSDVLPKARGINIFASLTRDFEPISSRLEDASKNLTVLAPRNGEIMRLPHKPWEHSRDYEQFGEANAYEGKDGQDRAKRNLEHFVRAHIIPTSPWEEGEEVETLGGEKLKWTKDSDKIYIQPGNIEVESIAEKVSNGEVWILNGVINYS